MEEAYGFSIVDGEKSVVKPEHEELTLSVSVYNPNVETFNTEKG